MACSAYNLVQDAVGCITFLIAMWLAAAFLTDSFPFRGR